MRQMASPLNPWLRTDESSPSRYHPHDDEEARGLLDDDDRSEGPGRGRIPRYQSSEMRGPELGRTGAFLGSLAGAESGKCGGLCPRISALFVAILTLVAIVRATSPSRPAPAAPLPTEAEGLTAIAESPKQSSDEDSACSNLSPGAKLIVHWVESLAGYELEPRSCHSMQRDSTLSCPLPIPVILPPPLRPEDVLTPHPPPKAGTKRHRTHAVAHTNKTSAAARRRVVSDEVACNQVVNWLRGYRGVFNDDVPTCAKSLVGTLQGTAETADGDILDLQLFGLPQIQQFEKFKLHPEWFTTIEKFGGGVGMGFQVFCNGEKILSAGCGTGGGYDPKSDSTYSTGWGGGVQLHFDKTGPIGVGLEGSNFDLGTFYANLVTTQARIKVCPKGALRVQGGSSYGGDVTVNGRKFAIGSKGDGWSMGTWRPPAPSKEAASPKTPVPGYESALPEVGSMPRPLLYSKRA